jgi:hypothetical protein
MKKLVIGMVAMTVAAGVLAQGTVVFNNRVVGTIVTKVYMPNPADIYTQQVGNSSADTPAGGVVYGGAALEGAGWIAELWAAPGANSPEFSLLAATPSTTFRTGAAAGWVAGTTANLTGVPGDSLAATVQMRVFPASFGTWAAAEAAWLADTTSTIFIGSSPLFNLSNIGGQVFQAPNLVGLESFSLVANIVPEPSTFALLGLGALGMFLFRRK